MTTSARTYGEYGGRYVPETLIPALDELETGWRAALGDPEYLAEVDELGRTYAGRPTPLTPSDLAQLYPRENGHRARDGVLLRGDELVARVVDRPWQQEDPEHFERARAAEGRVVLAGGLSPENVRAAIEAVRPWAVDASSSLETAPGIKDHERVRAFVEAAR